MLVPGTDRTVGELVVESGMMPELPAKNEPRLLVGEIVDNGWYDLSIGKLQRQMPSISRGSIHAGKQLAIQRREDSHVNHAE